MPRLERPSRASPIVNAKYLRLLFWPLWFVIVPAVLGYFTVTAIAPGPDYVGTSFLGKILEFVRDQRVPAIIVFFALYEMLLYRVRYHLPLAAYLGVVGRDDIPDNLQRDFEGAVHLLEEADRLLHRHRASIERNIPAAARNELFEAVEALREEVDRERLEPKAFVSAYERASDLVNRRLARWRKGEVREYVESIAVAMLVALTLRAVVIEAFKIPSGSMLPTLQIQDHIFVNKLTYGPMIPFVGKRIFSNLPPKRGDIMVFEYPDPDPTAERQDFIKRAIAFEGDTLEVDGGHPIINGWRVPSCRVGNYEFNEGGGYGLKRGELYIEFLGEYSYLTLYEDVFSSGRQGPYKIKPGETWVLGDNRNNSSDSRAWNHGRGGGVPHDNIKGRAMFVWLSFGTDASVTWDRLFTNVMGHPRLPKEAPIELTRGIERCLSQRPAQTYPPAAKP
ncbi:MAG TPA: signal peptidase I [Polyangiaceae bacterium]|nr:signal peptidase I [Polyangiaceae bacterium]